jgi:hypothetical protein
MALHAAHILTAVVATETPIELAVISGTITLDDAWTPYAQAQLTVYTPDQTFIDAIDPRENIRVTLTTSQTFLEGASARPAVTRSFDLMLRERRIDAETGTMTLYLESDEALLRDWALVSLTPDRIYGVSVKDAVDYALATIGATLEPGAADADVPSKELEPVLTNLLPNPSLEINANGWAAGTGRTTVSRSTAASWIGSASLKIQTTSAGSISATIHDLFAVASETQYTHSQYIKSGTARAMYLSMRFVNSSGSTIGSNYLDGPSVTTSSGAWTRLTNTQTAPVGTATVLVMIRSVDSSPSGDYHYLDGGMFNAGAVALDYFDGNALNGREAGLYATSWLSGIDSASTLTNLPNSDAMIWAPGLTAADYVNPLVNAAGLRLICDELRRWWLVTALEVDGQINVSTETGVISGEDTISRNDDSPWYDSVVIRYEWTDTDNLPQLAYDIAGTSGGRTLLQVVPRIFLGAGAAAAILERAQGKGRTFQVSSQSNYTATPGISVSIALPDTELQTGTLSSVSWSFPDSVMRIGSRGLTDTPAGAWLLAPTGRTWSNQPANTWNTYTNEGA